MESDRMSTPGAESLRVEVALSDAQRTYLHLKEMIVTLDLRPGSTINEPELQGQLGVGRTPLREALQRLSNEGLLQIYPRRAIVVSQIGVNEVRQIFEMRLVLEPAAAGIAAQVVGEADIEELQAISDALSGHREAVDFVRFLRDDHCFHRAVAACSRNMYLIDSIDHILTLNQWLWHIYFDSRVAERAAFFQHDPIVEALATHDATAAQSSMREHILFAKEQLLSGL